MNRRRLQEIGVMLSLYAVVDNFNRPFGLLYTMGFVFLAMFWTAVFGKEGS